MGSMTVEIVYPVLIPVLWMLVWDRRLRKRLVASRTNCY